MAAAFALEASDVMTRDVTAFEARSAWMEEHRSSWLTFIRGMDRPAAAPGATDSRVVRDVMAAAVLTVDVARGHGDA